MDPQHFDALTRRLSSAGSRRRVLTALVAGAFGRLLGPPGIDVVAAVCKVFNQSCGPNSPCCPKSGLRCRDGRCRCKNGWKRCTEGGTGCQNLDTDPAHCGECGNACPTGCCVKGKCREMCGDDCCPDCFVEIFSDGNPDEDNPICCKSSGGTICEHNKPGKADDRCCYDDEVCVKGKCCCHAMGAGCQGAIKCGGKCCAIAACCNGKCCEKGYVCATKEADDPKETCVPANRDCNGVQDCFPGESCLDGKCCSGPRECEDADGNPFCCGARRYCDSPGGPDVTCCPINTICNSTYRGHRVRR